MGKIDILSHRGVWQNAGEKNTFNAIQLSCEMGYGVETDIRDANNDLIIAHDPFPKEILYLERILEMFRSKNYTFPLALNIKSDGLAERLQALLKTYEIENYFCFDMSVPEGLQYQRIGLKVYNRLSEYETQPFVYQDAKGVWLDEFHGEWFDKDTFKNFNDTSTQICVVSPELHGRDYKVRWERLKKLTEELPSYRWQLCTDFPDKAQEFFHE